MNFHLNFPIEKASFQIEHGNKIALIGSCFSDSIATHFSRAGFEVCVNPFGTIFHPSAIAELISRSIDSSDEFESIQRNDLFFSWDSASKISGNSESELRQKLIDKRVALRSFMMEASVLFITFGTSWGYELRENGRTVANCHKMPADLFSKQLMSVDGEYLKWVVLIEKIRVLNPELKLVFTVSPVRHSKDGLVENNRSKARLLELVHSLHETTESIYFPSYEIVIDELRDYRFFKEDRIHPTDEAVNYVWNRLEDTFFREETKELARLVNRALMALDHRSILPESKEVKEHTNRSIDRINTLKREYPMLYFSS